VPDLAATALAAASRAAGLLADATPSSSSGAPRGLDPEDVSPGLAGFLTSAALVVVVVLLALSMVRRLRRIRHRADLEMREAAALEAERAAAEAARSGPRRPAAGELPDPSADGRTVVGDEPEEPPARGENHLE
jgi:hypothetical protein